MQKLPEMRRHRDRRRNTDRAYVRVDGRRRYLGDWGAPETQRAYDRLLAEWLANGRRLHEPEPEPGAPASITVAELCRRHRAHAEVYYRHPSGLHTGQHKNVEYALEPVEHLFGDLAADRFMVMELKAVRAHMVSKGLSRGVVNQRVGIIRRAFRWAEGEGLVPEGKYEHLRSLSNLKSGRSEARDTDPVEPVSWKDVEKTLPELSPVLRAMVLVQWHTGMRPGEVRMMRRREVDTSGDVWLYRPGQHKNAHRGHERVVPLGPQAQEAMRPFIEQPHLGFLFPPDRGGPYYTKRAYRRAIDRACARAGVPSWCPLQLRHAFATRLRKAGGVEDAQVLLGHKRVETTQIYAERDLDRAVELARKLG